jgi:hypothetical protein
MLFRLPFASKYVRAVVNPLPKDSAVILSALSVSARRQ